MRDGSKNTELDEILDTLVFNACEYETGKDVDLDASTNKAKSQIQELIATARIDGLIMARYGVDYDSKEERFIDNLIRQEEAELEDK
jgi:cell division protein YceG involved in septum cleavage